MIAKSNLLKSCQNQNHGHDLPSICINEDEYAPSFPKDFTAYSVLLEQQLMLFPQMLSPQFSTPAVTQTHSQLPINALPDIQHSSFSPLAKSTSPSFGNYHKTFFGIAC